MSDNPAIYRWLSSLPDYHKTHHNDAAIAKPMQIGMTDNLPNIYQLLTVLGFLGVWIDTTFRSWVINAFCPRT
jgi:hypothetical protein